MVMLCGNVFYVSFHTCVFTNGVNGKQSLLLHIRTFHLKLETIEQQPQIRPQRCRQNGDMCQLRTSPASYDATLTTVERAKLLTIATDSAYRFVVHLCDFIYTNISQTPPVTPSC